VATALPLTAISSYKYPSTVHQKFVFGRKGTNMIHAEVESKQNIGLALKNPSPLTMESLGLSTRSSSLTSLTLHSQTGVTAHVVKWRRWNNPRQRPLLPLETCLTQNAINRFRKRLYLSRPLNDSQELNPKTMRGCTRPSTPGGFS
jgi:hypothetical protein